MSHIIHAISTLGVIIVGLAVASAALAVLALPAALGAV